MFHFGLFLIVITLSAGVYFNEKFKEITSLLKEIKEQVKEIKERQG